MITRRGMTSAVLAGVLMMGLGGVTWAQAEASATDLTIPNGLSIKFDAASSPKAVSQSLQIVFLLTALSLAPSAIIMMTSFTRILIVLGILRQALGLQNIPPGQVISGMALFLTMFTMAPVWEKINTDALKPYIAEEISQEEMIEKGLLPLKSFMLRQTGESELALFFELANKPKTKTAADIPLQVLVSAFMISELKTALQMAFLLYLPFMVVDLVVSSVLMSLGMMMLPPMMVSLPIKILLFILADGWTLLIRGLVSSFSM